MSNFNYARSAATATRLLTRFGTGGAVRRSATTGGNDWDPSSGTTTNIDYPCIVVVTDYNNRDIDGTVILQTDKRVLMAPGVAVVPTTSDSVVLDGYVFTIVNVNPIRPATTLVLYDLQVRGGALSLIAPSLDLADPANSQYLVLLEDI